MNYAFLEIKTFRSKGEKNYHVLYVLDLKYLVVEDIFINEEQMTFLNDFKRFDDISSLIDYRYNQKAKCYELALC